MGGPMKFSKNQNRKPQTQNALRSTEKTIKIRPKTIPNDQ